MQTITRTKLSVIYPKVCSGWQQKIDTILNSQKFSESIEVSDQLITEAFNAADAEQKKWLTKNFTLPKSKSDLVNTFQDVLKHMSKKLEDILPWKNPVNKDQVSQNAFAKIQLITAFYNGETKMDWTNRNQYKYYIWWERRVRGGWVFYGVDDCSYCCGGGGSGCFFANSDSAKDAAKKFKDIFIEYLPE